MCVVSAIGPRDGVAIPLPLNELRDKMGELPSDKELVVFCAVGLRGYVAYRLLAQAGYRVENLSGGFTTYQMFEGIH